MRTWTLELFGMFDDEAMLPTIVELGGKWQGRWLMASECHPQFICRRLAENMSGPFLVRLKAV